MLGVDFGSSNTAAAFRDSSGGIHQISLSHNGWLMPSAVLYKSTGTLVGRTAVQANLTEPDAFEPSPKRRLAEGHIQLGGVPVDVTDLVAAVLREVFAKAQRETGHAPDRVVLTHPDKWALPMQELLRKAAVQAGVDDSQIRLISEASAAAWYYTVTERALPVGARLAVFDFGAGTCDVAVLDKQHDQTFRVIASDGIEGLGGHDLDARIHSWVRAKLTDIDPQLAAELAQPGAIGARLTLNDRIRDAKEALSEAPDATIAVTNGTRTRNLTLTRDEFNHLISRDLDRAVALTERVLADAQRDRPVDKLTKIYLTGGSSAIPAVHARLSSLGPLGNLGDPKTVVSQGALHAMVTMWDAADKTMHIAKMDLRDQKDHPLSLTPPEKDKPGVAGPTEPASNPEIPWYLQKPVRPQQPPKLPEPRQPERPPVVVNRPGPQPAPGPGPVPGPGPGLGQSRPQIATNQPGNNHPSGGIYRPPSGPNQMPQQPPGIPPANQENRMPWIIAGVIIAIAVLVALIAIALAL